jgi:hypothetical protein
MMPEQRFTTTVGTDDSQALFIAIPSAVIEALGAKKRPPVRVTLNIGYTYRSTVAVYGGRYYLPIRREIREAAGLAPGMPLEVTLALDEAPRTVEAPADLAVALALDPEAQAAFDQLSYTHRKEYVKSITSAKRETTRQRRIQLILARLRLQTRSSARIARM